MQEQPIIFFDGVCGLCNGFVDFVMKIDKKKVHRFAALQGETAARLLHKTETQDLDSVVYLYKTQKLKKSRAVLQVFKNLGGIWWAFSLLQIVPSPILDFFYDLVAKFRYVLFGKKETCRIPTREERALFLD